MIISLRSIRPPPSVMSLPAFAGRSRLSLLLAVGLLATAVHGQGAKVPVPGDCIPHPYQEVSVDADAGDSLREQLLHLDCRLSAINSDRERTNFSVIPAEHTASLAVSCADSISVSHLDPEGFRSLLWLEELSLEDCNVHTIPDRAFLGLTRLHTLKIKSSQVAGKLRLTSQSMEGLANIRRLHLSNNPVEVVRPSCLCSLPNLIQLDMSNTHITSLEDLGLTISQTYCMSKLHQLDLSHNSIGEVTGLHLRKLSQLTHLNLSHNSIRYLDLDVFSFNPDLESIDLSGNQLTSLPAGIFAPSRMVSLILANNSLESLPSRIFESLEHLQELDLSCNKLTDLKPGLFGNTSRLRTLQLAHNRLAKLRKRAFSHLPHMEHLNASFNELDEVPSKLFKSLPNVRVLDLSHNKLTGLADDTFAGLQDLIHLILSHNQLREIGNQTLVPLYTLLLLDVSHNQLVQVPKSLKSLLSLQSLDLASNQISSLEDDDLDVPSMWRLNLQDNLLDSLGRNALSHLTSLQILDLSTNKIRKVEDGALDMLQQLQAVRLDNNHLSRLDKMFTHLPGLTWLNVSANRIVEFDLHSVPRSLVWLDLHANRLETVENYYGIEGGMNIQHLDVSFNRLRGLRPSSLPNSVQVALFNDNDIVDIAPNTFVEKTRLKKVDLSVNDMRTIDQKALRIAGDFILDPTTALPRFLLGGNPIECNCDMIWLKTVNKAAAKTNSPGTAAASTMQGNRTAAGTTPGGFPIIADLESIYCKLPYSRREITFSPLVEADPSTFLCEYRTHCFEVCHCCDYDACDCEMSCPVNCNCYHDTTWSANIVECTATNLTTLPPKMPMDATEMFLDGNNLVRLKSHMFIGRKNLRVLHLNGSNIVLVENNTFNGLPSMEILHLEGNKITKFEGDEFKGMPNLRELYLQDNQIASIANITFTSLHSLQILHLHSNRLSVFPVWVVNGRLHPQLASVKLAANRWSCSCGYLGRMADWLHANHDLVTDLRDLRCHKDDILAPIFVENGPLDLCNGGRSNGNAGSNSGNQESRQLIASDSELEDDLRSEVTDLAADLSMGDRSEGRENIIMTRYLIPILVGGVLIIVASVVTLVTLLYRQEIKLWLYTKYGIRFFQRVDNGSGNGSRMGGGSGTGTCADQEKVYDLFVVYSAEDDLYVQQVFAAELEMSQYKVCLYHRDLSFSSCHFIADLLGQTTDISRRTVLVLSENIIKQECTHYEFRTGLLQILRTLGKRLIVILLGDVTLRDLDAEMRQLVSHSDNIIQWGEAKFWQKVRFALPDIPLQLGLSKSTTLQSYPSTLQSSGYAVIQPYLIGNGGVNGGGSTPSPPTFGHAPPPPFGGTLSFGQPRPVISSSATSSTIVGGCGTTANNAVVGPGTAAIYHTATLGHVNGRQLHMASPTDRHRYDLSTFDGETAPILGSLIYDQQPVDSLLLTTNGSLHPVHQPRMGGPGTGTLPAMFNAGQTGRRQGLNARKPVGNETVINGQRHNDHIYQVCM